MKVQNKKLDDTNMQDPLIKNHRCDFVSTDINGNEKEAYRSHNSKGSNHCVNVNSDSSFFSKQHPSAAKTYLSEAELKNTSIKGSTELKTTNIKGGTELKNTSVKDSRDDTRKLSPLRISRSRIFFWNDQKDEDKTPEYPLKEDDAFFKTLTHSNETLSTQVNAKSDEQNRNLIEDFSTSVPAAISPCDQAKTPQYADIYQNGKFKENKQTITPNVAQTSFQENRSLNENILQIEKSDSSKPKVLGSHLKPETHSSFLEATGNYDPESKRKTSTAKIMYKTEKFHDNKEGGQQNNEQIPLLSQINIHNEDAHTLFSPQYSLQPPTLIRISNDNLDVKSNKKGESNNFSSQVKLSSKCKIHSNQKLSKQEQKSSISSSDLDSLKYSPKNNCQTMKSESNNSEKESKVQSHSVFDNKVLEISEQQETLKAFVEEKSCLSSITCVGNGNSMVRDSPHNSTYCELVKSCCDANSKGESTQYCNKGCVYSSTSHTNTENCESGIFLDNSNHHGSNGVDNADLKTESRIADTDQSLYHVSVKTTDLSLHPDKQTTNLDVQCQAGGHAGGGHAQSQCVLNSHTEFPSTSNSHSEFQSTSNSHSELPSNSNSHTELPSTSNSHSEFQSTSNSHSELPSMKFASRIELPTTELISISKPELTLCSDLTSATHSELSTSKTEPNSITKQVLESTAQKSQVKKNLLNVPGGCLLLENMINECTDDKPAEFSLNIDDGGMIQNKDVSCRALSTDKEPEMKSRLLDKQLVSKCPMDSTMNMDSPSKECSRETATEQILIHFSERMSKSSTSSDDLQNKAARKCQSFYPENHSKNDKPDALLYSLATAAWSKTTEQPAAQSKITEQLALQSKTTEQLALQSKITEQLALQSKITKQLTVQSKTTEQLAVQSKTTEHLAVQSKTTEHLAVQSKTTEQLTAQSKTTEQLAPPPLDETSTDEQECTAFEKSNLCVMNISDSGSEYATLICDKTMTPLSKHMLETTHSDITNMKTVEIAEKCSNGSDKTNEKYLTKENGLAGANGGFSKHLILPSKEPVKFRRRKSSSSESSISSCDKKVDSVTLKLHEHETSRKKSKMEAHSNETVAPLNISCGDSMDCDFQFSPEKKTLYSPLWNYRTANIKKVLHFADRGHRENNLVIHSENLAICEPNNKEQLTAMPKYKAQYDPNSQRNASTVSENLPNRKNVTKSVLPKIISEDNASSEQFLSSSASTTYPSQTTDKSKGNTELSYEHDVIHLHKLSNHQEGISEATDLPLSLAENKNTDIHSSSKPRYLLSQKGLNMPEKWATLGSLSVQDSAAKSMKLKIIQRMAERSTGNKKRTDRRQGKLNHFKNTSDQPKVTFSNTTYAEVKNISSDGEGHNTHEQIDTSEHSVSQRLQHKQAAARHSMSHNAQSEATGRWLDMQTSKSTHSQYPALQEAHPDPLWANMPHRPYFMGETSIRNTMLPAITPPSLCNRTPPTSCNRSAIISSPQQVLKLGLQPAFNRSSLHTVLPLSAEQMNLCRQIHPSQLKPTQQETNPEETCKYPSQVQIPCEASYNPSRASTEVSNERTTKIPGSHDLYQAYNQNWQHNEIQLSGPGSSTNPQLDNGHTDITSQYLSAPCPHLFWSGQSPDLQSPSHGYKYRLSVKENTTEVCYDDQNIQDKPLDLSKNIETQINNCTDTQLLLLNSHVQFQEGVDKSNLKSHDRDHYTQPAKLPNYFSLPCPTSNQLSLQIQDDRYSKGQPALNKTSLSWPNVSSINSPSATQPTLKHDVICDEGSRLEATMQDKFVTDNRNNHSSEKLDQISSKPQMIHFYMDNPLHSPNNGNISIASDNILAQSVHSSPETSKACPVSNSSKLMFDSQIPVVTSAELISPLIDHNQETQLTAVLPAQEITRSALSREKTGSLSMTPSLNGYSNSPDFQQRTNSQNSIDSRSSTLSDNTGNVKSVSPRVVPLPVKDFFTSSSRENTYSSLLMAKITSQHKKPTNLQKGNELFLSNEPQRTSNNCVFEIGNNFQRNFVIDLTAGDDDCNKLNIISKENELQDETSRNKVLGSPSEDFSRVNKINRYSSFQQLDKINHEAIGNGTSHYNREVYNLENQSSKERIGSSEFSLPVRDCENILEKQFLQHNCVEDAVGYNSMSNSGEISKACTQNIMPQANLRTYFSYQSNEFSDKKAGHSLKIAPKRKEIMARTVKTVVETWPASVRQEEISLALPLMNENNVRTSLRTGYINSGELMQADINQIPAHDNSTQRAAATLLELSANPEYNSNLLLPETSDDYQEKVYQIHHKLNVDDNGKKYPAQNEPHNINMHRFGLVESGEIIQTAANKSGPRTQRRVGRPPKDQYVSSASSAGEVSLLNSAISKEAAIPPVTLPSHNIPYNPPLPVFSSKVFCEPHFRSQATVPVMFPPVVIEPGSLTQTNSIQEQQSIRVMQQSRAAVTTSELLKHLTHDPASHTVASMISNMSMESSRNCLEVTNEDHAQIRTRQTIDKFVGHPDTSYCISSIGSHISASDTLLSTSLVHNKIPGHRTSHDAGLNSKKHCLDVVCKMSLNTNTTFSHLVQPSVDSLLSPTLESNSQTPTDPSTYPKKPASNADSLQLSCSTHFRAKNRISNVVPCISTESSLLLNKLNIVNDTPLDQTSAYRRLILKRKTARRHKQKHLQLNSDEESKLLSVAAPYNEHDQEAGTSSRLHINRTETNGKHNGVPHAVQVQNDGLHEKRNMKKRKSKLQHSKITKKRKKAAVNTSNEMYPAQDKNERCKEIVYYADETINECMQHVYVPVEVSGDLAVKDSTMKLTSYGDQFLNASHNGEQEDHMPFAVTTTEVILKHKRYETVSSSANVSSNVSDGRQTERIVAQRGVTNSEASESEKEKEVTSLLAALMYNKYKGRIN